MSGAARLAAFAALLVVLFGAAAWAGTKADPDVTSLGHADSEMGAMNAEHPTVVGDDAAGESSAQATGSAGSDGAGLPGLAVAEAGYRLVSDETILDPSPQTTVRFRIVDEDGATVQDFDTEHTRRMHLIIVRHDFADFQHLHPTQLVNGAWEAKADLGPGVYRAFADFATAGQALTLGTDLFVSGHYQAQPLPAPSETARAGDGYAVKLASEPAVAGSATAVAFQVSRHGRPLDSVEPYLGADGHLVVLREHDQAFLHVHPELEPGGSGPIRFAVEYPSQGRYRFYLQFEHRGQVHTAAFTQAVGTGAINSAASEEADGH